nr:RNA 3' terminal phosphate cyclase protein [Hymenolepis microstoma]
MSCVVYEDGAVGFRQKIVLSVLTYKPIRIKNIRNKSKNPGVTSEEVDLLKLVNEISNGAIVRINDTGCNVYFSPGTLIGGELVFKCSAKRGLGYYLEPLFLLCSFTKLPLHVTLNGVTNNSIDPSVDVIAQSWIPFLKDLLPEASKGALALNIVKRGVPPKGGGQVVFTSKPALFLAPLQLVKADKVYRIRGVAWTCRVSPAFASQVMTGAKQLLNTFLSDVYITLDQRKREFAGVSSGFGIVLWAVTKEKLVYTAEACNATECGKKTSPNPVIPSELGLEAASRLLNQIYLGGCVDESLQSVALSLMALEGGRNASQLLISEPTPHTVQTLRLLQKTLGVTFDLSYADRVKSNGFGLQTEAEATVEEGMKDGMQTLANDDIDLDGGGDVEKPIPLLATCFGSGIKNINMAIR